MHQEFLTPLFKIIKGYLVFTFKFSVSLVHHSLCLFRQFIYVYFVKIWKYDDLINQNDKITGHGCVLMLYTGLSSYLVLLLVS